MKIKSQTLVGKRALAAGGLLASILLLAAPWTRSQTAVQVWVQRYSHPVDADDYAQKVVIDNAGNVIVAGYTDEQITGRDFLIIKYSAAGVSMWTNRYNGPGNGDDQAYALAVDGSGNVFVAGYSDGGGGNYDYATVKYSSAGVALWTNRYNGPGDAMDEARAVAVDGNNNVFVTGRSYGSGSFTDYATVAYSSAGVPLWTNRYNGPGDSYDMAKAVAVDGSGNVFVTGESGICDIHCFYDYTTVAYSGGGVPLWTNRYEGAATALAVDGSGNVLVTGWSYGSSSHDYATIKYSGAGVPLWTNRYNEPGNDVNQASAVAVDGNGNVFVTGSSGSGSYDYATVAYSAAGAPLWTNRYNDGAAIAIAVDGIGSVFVTGSSDGDYTTIKYSGTGLPLWTNRYNISGSYDDQANAVAVDSNGNVLVTGSSYGGVSYYDYATIKYSGAGVPLWTNRHNGPGNNHDQANAVAVDSSGNVIVTGWSYGSGSSWDYATIKYSGAGVPSWTNRYNGPGNREDQATGLVVDDNGNVFVTGSSYGSDGSWDYATIKYSAAGAPLWTNRYNGSGNGDDFAVTVEVDGSGSVFVTGSSYGSDGSWDYATIKYSDAGVSLWTNRYNGPRNGDDYASGIAVDGSGKVFVTGRSASTNVYPYNSDYATIKYSAAGLPLWTNRYNGPGNGDDFAVAVAVDGSGNAVVTGSSYGSGGVSLDDYATIKYSGAGVPLWTNRYNSLGNGPDIAWAVAVDGSGSVLVTGASANTNDWPYNYDYATVKYSAAGVPLWTNRYNGPANLSDEAAAVAADGDSNVFVTGTSWSGSSLDYATIRYSGAGVPLWTNRYNGPANGDDRPSRSCLAIGPDSAVYVTGASDGNYTDGTTHDFATIKYVSVPQLVIERDGNGGFFIRIHGMPGVTYRLQRASSVTGTWSGLATNTAPASGVIEFQDTSPLPGQAFYRTVQP